MAADLLLALARCNIAAGVAIFAVLAMRQPLRRWFGAGRAYAVWLVAPFAATGSLMPARLTAGAPGPVETANDHAFAWLSVGGHARALAFLWLSGALVTVTLAAWRHARFCAAVKSGCAGPAAVGVIQPRLVVPADFAQRFTGEERRLVRAHERAHMDRLDARYNAAAALAGWVCWFNPALHLAFRAMRSDQEMACDATVLGRLPAARRLYAETLLRAHQAPAAPVLGCQWRSRGIRPLEARIRMLRSTPPSQAHRDLGLAIVVASCAATFGAAWAMQPPARAVERATIILVDLAPPDAAETSLAAAVYRAVEMTHDGPVSPGMSPRKQNPGADKSHSSQS